MKSKDQPDRLVVEALAAARSPIFWLALALVVVGTAFSTRQMIVGGDRRGYDAATYILFGALLIGLLSLRWNRPLSVGLLVGLFVCAPVFLCALTAWAL